MIYQPKGGQYVRIQYRPPLRPENGLHRHYGHILKVGSGRGPKNCLVHIAGRDVVIPRGNLFKIDEIS